MKAKQVIIMVLAFAIVCGTVIAADSGGTGQPAKHDAGDLAKKTQNPVSDLISLPLQYNMYFDTGDKGGTQNVLLVQPVIPFKLNEDWNFIARPIIPLINQPPFTDGQNRNHGLGNIQFEGFFSPKDKVGDWIIGFGPIFEFPTNSGPDGRLGSDNWSAGPAFVALQMKGPWVYGSLATHLWSYCGNDPEVNLTFLNPFINYNLKDGWYLNSAPVITANWAADSSNTWTVPVGGGVGKVFHVGKQPVNTRVGAYYNVETPDTGADWQFQFQVQFLFPK
ncbi:MAG: neuromedin U [Planctomycetota bacterium]